MADEDTPTPDSQPDPRDAEITRLKGVADRYAHLDGIASALEADPGKFYAVQAALNGTQPSPQPAQSVAAPQPLSATDLEELKQKFFNNPVGMAAEIADLARKQAIAEYQADAAPIVATTSDLFIETFKARKAGEDPMYKTIAPAFDREMGDVNRMGLLRLPAAERQRILELRYAAASDSVFRAVSAKQQRDQAPNLGSGSGSGGGQNPGNKGKSVYEKDPGLMELTQRLIDQGLISQKDLEDSESEMEYENS